MAMHKTTKAIACQRGTRNIHGIRNTFCRNSLS